MSYYAAYSPVFTGSIEDPTIGVKVNDYDNFTHLFDTIDLAFDPVVTWRTEDEEQYPQQRYAYFQGFSYPDEDASHYLDMRDVFCLNKVTPGSTAFSRAWYAAAMTCEQFSVLLSPRSGNFPRLNSLILEDGDAYVYRLDFEPGRIEQWEMRLTGEETLYDEYEWDRECYVDERFI